MGEAAGVVRRNVPPCVDEGGRVVGWNVRNGLNADQAGLNHLRPIEAGLPCLRAACGLLQSEELSRRMDGAKLG